MEGVKTWLSSQAAEFSDTHRNLFPDTTASVPAVTTLRSNLSIYVFSVYNKNILIACFVNSSPEVIFPTALV
jgi:hypothetical protein